MAGIRKAHRADGTGLRGHSVGGFSVSRARSSAGRAALSLAVMTLVVVGSAAPAAAAPTASISATTVSAGDEVTISGAGWTPDRGVFLVIEANGMSFFLPNAGAGSDGSFSVTRVWPAEIPPGDHVLSVSGTASAPGEFIDLPITVEGSEPPPISAPTVSVTPASVAPGEEVTVSGTGWDLCCTVGITLYLNGTDFFPGPDFAGSLISLLPEFDRTFGVTATVPSDVPPGDHVIRVFGSAGDFETPVDAPITVLGAEPPPEEQPPAGEEPPVVSPTPTSPGGPIEPQVGGATESSTAAGGSASELPRTGSWSAVLIGIGALLVLAGGLLIGFSLQGRRRARVSRKLALVRVVALVMSAMLLVAACGDDGDDGDDSSDDQTEEPADDGDGDGGEDVDVEGLDYAGALFTTEDLEGIVPGDYVAGDLGSAADFELRSLCGQGVVGPKAAEGAQLDLDDADETLSFTTSVQAFGTVEEAETALELSRAIAESCDVYISESSGNQFARAPAPGIAESGDESFDLFAANTESGLLVGDSFVRSGQFVFNTRIIKLSTAPYTDEVLATLAEGAGEKFIDWVEETTA